jgi:hypothetical protein
MASARARVQGRGGRRDGEDDVAHVVDAGVGHHPLEIALRQRDEGAVQRGEGGDAGDIGRGVAEGAGRHLQRESDEAVRPELEQHAGQHHAARGGGLDVRRGQPGVQREDGGLDGEGDQEGDQGHGGGEAAKRWRRDERAHVEGARMSAQVEQQDAQQRVQEEGQGGALPPRVAPAGDDEVHRHQVDLEKDVEDDQVEGQEDAETGRLQQHEQGDIGARALAHAERVHQGDEEEHGRHQDERGADAVDADAVGCAQRGDPGHLLDLGEMRPHAAQPDPQGAQ